VSDEEHLRLELVEVGRRLYTRGLVSGHEGNVSVRMDDTLLVTPTGVCKGFLRPEDLVKTDLDGRGPGAQRASMELPLHAEIYRRRDDVRAVVHAHPPTATGFAVAGISLDQPLTAEAVAVLGCVPIVPYRAPASSELAEAVGRAILTAQALLLANHGALTVGESLERAWERMESLEMLARVTLVTRLLGQVRFLPTREVERLLALGARVGYPPSAADEEQP
jgi:L-fuculose-phosphate aldolase